MSQDPTLDIFNTLEYALDRIECLMSAAEIHGLLCGVICSGKEVESALWLQPIADASPIMVEDIPSEIKMILMALHNGAVEHLTDIAFTFQLLLPRDKTLLKLRAMALSDWCGGFLSGLGMSGVKLEPNISRDVREALVKFSEIIQIDYEHVEAGEEDEVAFSQLTEYVRMAVLMIYTELVMVKRSGGEFGTITYH